MLQNDIILSFSQYSMSGQVPRNELFLLDLNSQIGVPQDQHSNSFIGNGSCIDPLNLPPGPPNEEKAYFDQLHNLENPIDQQYKSFMSDQSQIVGVPLDMPEGSLMEDDSQKLIPEDLEPPPQKTKKIEKGDGRGAHKKSKKMKRKASSQQSSEEWRLDSMKKKIKDRKKTELKIQQPNEKALEKVEANCGCSQENCKQESCNCYDNGLMCGSQCKCKCQAEVVEKSQFVEKKVEDFSGKSEGKGKEKQGCSCKKTKCKKRYCECFNEKRACGSSCKCYGCENIEKQE